MRDAVVQLGTTLNMSHADTCRFLLSIPSAVTDFRTFSRSLTASDSPKLFGLVLVSVPNLMRENLPSATLFRARDVNNSEAEFEFNAFVSRSTRAGDPILVNAKASIRSPGKFHLDEAELVHPLWVGKIRFDFLPALKSGDSFCKTAKSRRENVPCRIHIAVVSRAALTAIPFPYSQTRSTFRTAGGNASAARASLG